MPITYRASYSDAYKVHRAVLVGLSEQYFWVQQGGQPVCNHNSTVASSWSQQTNIVTIMVKQLTLPLGLHCWLHSSNVPKLFSLPSQPPYMNSSHTPVFELKKYRGIAASQGPGSAGKTQNAASGTYTCKYYVVPDTHKKYTTKNKEQYSCPSIG